MKAHPAFESLGLGPEAAVFHWNRPPGCESDQKLRYLVRFGLADHRLGASIAMTDDAVEACERKAYF